LINLIDFFIKRILKISLNRRSGQYIFVSCRLVGYRLDFRSTG